MKQVQRLLKAKGKPWFNLLWLLTSKENKVAYDDCMIIIINTSLDQAQYDEQLEEAKVCSEAYFKSNFTYTSLN